MPCCTPRNDFQTAMLLVIAVAVPFIVAVLIFYGYAQQDNLRPKLLSCDDYCLQNYTNETVEDLFEEYERSFVKCPNYPIDPKVAMVGSFHEILGEDETVSTLYLCPVSILTKGIAIVSKTCIRPKTGPSKYFIRIGSMFANKGGTVHRVSGFIQNHFGKLVPNDQLSLIEYNHDLPDYCGVPVAEVTYIDFERFIKSKKLQSGSVYQYKKNETSGELRLNHFQVVLESMEKSICRNRARESHQNLVCVKFVEKIDCVSGSLLYFNTIYFMGASVHQDCKTGDNNDYAFYEKISRYYAAFKRLRIRYLSAFDHPPR